MEKTREQTKEGERKKVLNTRSEKPLKTRVLPRRKWYRSSVRNRTLFLLIMSLATVFCKEAVEVEANHET